MTANAMVVDTERLPDPASNSARVLSAGSRQRLGPDDPVGERAVEGPAALHHVLVFDRVGRRGSRTAARPFSRAESGISSCRYRRSRSSLSWAGGHLLDLVGGVAGLDLGPEGPALDGLGQDDGRLAGGLGGRLVGGVQLAVVVAAPRQVAQVVVGEVLDQGPQPGVGAEEVLADVGAVLGGVLLELAVDGGVHLVEQDPVDVAGSSSSHLPPHTTLMTFQPAPRKVASSSWMILPLPADRTVEALEVAVDDEDQVVELFPGGQRQGAEGLGLVALAVAEEAPHPALRGVGDAAVLQVAVEVGLVDGVERAEPHRHRRELPEVRHEPGVGVRRQPARIRPGGPAAPCGSSSAGPRSAGLP